MNKPKVFSMNECDWWMAPTREQAIADYLAMTGLDADECIDDPHELSDESMQTLKYANAPLPKSLSGELHPAS
jgi:hypothetical protein